MYTIFFFLSDKGKVISVWYLELILRTPEFWIDIRDMLSWKKKNLDYCVILARGVSEVTLRSHWRRRKLSGRLCVIIAAIFWCSMPSASYAHGIWNVNIPHSQDSRLPNFMSFTQFHAGCNHTFSNLEYLAIVEFGWMFACNIVNTAVYVGHL